MKAQKGSSGVAPLIHLGTRWRRTVSFTSWPFYPREKPSTSRMEDCVGTL